MLSIFKRKGWGELNQKRNRQREKTNLTNLFTLTHCASERKRIAALLICAFLSSICKKWTLNGLNINNNNTVFI